MIDFNILVLAKLFNLVKTEVYNKHENDLVHINERKESKNELKETYENICKLYHKDEEMTNKELFDFLKLKINNVRVIL